MSINKYFDKVFHINLDRRVDRNNNINSELSKHNIESTRISAIDGSTVELPSYWVNNKGSYGCLKSHLNIIKHAKEMCYKTILILEDDVIFSDDLDSIFDSYFNQVPNDWNILYLSGNHNLHCGYSLDFISDKIIRCRMTYSTHSYCVNSNFYDKLIEVLENSNKPIDVTYSDMQKYSNFYSFYPGITSQRNDYSDIEQSDVDYSKYIK